MAKEKIKDKVPSEYEEQKIVVKYLTELKEQEKIITFFATTNENTTYKQSKKWAIIAEIKARASGKRKGVSDLCVVLWDKVLFIEMKKNDKKARTKKEQIEFLKDINTSTACFGSVCYGARDAIDYINLFIKDR